MPGPRRQGISTAFATPPWCDMVINSKLSLSEKEREVLRRFQSGLGLEAAAASLGISVGAVRQRQASAALKLGAKSRTEAVSTAQKLGLL